MERRIKIDEADMNELKKAHFEHLSFISNVSFMLEQHANDPAFLVSDAFKKYRELQAQNESELEEIKAYIAVKYLPDELLSTNYSWTADFKNKELVVNV